MNTFLVALFIGILTTCFANDFVVNPMTKYNPSLIHAKNTNPNATLIEIGIFNRTTYYTDRVLRNWTESKSLCQSRGLMLAKIDNEEQLLYLREVVRAAVLQNWTWVANTGDYEDYRNSKKSQFFHQNVRCPILGPYGRGYIRRPCFYIRFALCQTLDSSDETELDRIRNFE